MVWKKALTSRKVSLNMWGMSGGNFSAIGPDGADFFLDSRQNGEIFREARARNSHHPRRVELLVSRRDARGGHKVRVNLLVIALHTVDYFATFPRKIIFFSPNWRASVQALFTFCHFAEFSFDKLNSNFCFEKRIDNNFSAKWKSVSANFVYVLPFGGIFNLINKAAILSFFASFLRIEKTSTLVNCNE